MVTPVPMGEKMMRRRKRMNEWNRCSSVLHLLLFHLLLAARSNRLVTSFTTSDCHSAKPSVRVVVTGARSASRRFSSSSLDENNNNNNNKDGQVGSGPNWIERSFPVDVTEADQIDPKKVEDYNLGISGKSFQTGPLSRRMFEVMTKNKVSSSSRRNSLDPELERAYKIYAMDFTAKEACKVALQQNGLQLVLTDDEQDEGMWGDIDSIRLLPMESQNEGEEEEEQPKLFGIPTSSSSSSFDRLYDSWDEAVDDWTPGQGFDFVARNVPAKLRELQLSELLQALDPQGTLREEAKERGIVMPDEEGENEPVLQSLSDLAKDNVQRVERAPREAVDATQAYAGNLQKRGYRPLPVQQLLCAYHDDDECSEPTLMHVMDALVSHGCVLVDLTKNDATASENDDDDDRVQIMHRMWKTCQNFFDNVAKVGLDRISDVLPGMITAQETGSPHAKVGFASYSNGDLQVLETRLQRGSEAEPSRRVLLPSEAVPLLGPDGPDALRKVFDMVTAIGKEVVRIAVAASTLEAGALDDRAQAFEAARRLANELLDDGKPLAVAASSADDSIRHSEGTVSMSPHRLCRYANQKSPDTANLKDTTAKKQNTREIFGAHTDSTFLTIVPVASVPGLEVYDEDVEQWYRPELTARQHWLQHYHDDASTIPWHCRYVILMPGELLQLATRDEIPAAVHRVVATSSSSSSSSPRLSAPILLRARPGTRWNSERYLGGLLPHDALLRECDGMAMEEIHDKMQPTPLQS